MPENMSEKSPAPPALAVGVRVSVRRPSESAATGEIVGDYAELTGSGERGHEWAPVRRWAVALDDGRLGFADTDDLIVDPGAPRSAPRAGPAE